MSEEIPDNCLPPDDVLAQLGFEKISGERLIEHDLDGTPLPVGHQEYTAEQERFDALWKKWDAGTITPDERAEMLKMQEDYCNEPKLVVDHAKRNAWIKGIATALHTDCSPEPTGEEKRK